MMCDVGNAAIKDAIANIARNREVLHFLSCIARFLGHFSGLPTTRQTGLLPSNGQRGAVSVDRKQTSYMFVFWRVADNPPKTIRPKPDWDLSHRSLWTTASRFRVPSSGTQSNTEARRAESTQIRVALVPFGGLLVSMREAKNSGFTSRWTADLHPDRQPFSSETARNGDCRQPQRIKRPGVVQHPEFLRSVSIRIPQIGNLERRDRRRRSDHQVHVVEDTRHGVANLVELASALNIGRCCYVCPGKDSLERGRLVKLWILKSVVLVILVSFRQDDREGRIHDRCVGAIG